VIAELHSRLALRLGSAERDWLEVALRRVHDDPAAISVLFPAAGRGVGRRSLDESEDHNLNAWTVDDAARALLLDSLGPRAVLHIGVLYRHGDVAERRGVLRALPLLELGDQAAPLVEDAVRTNDPRLVSAALGPYAFDHLSDAAVEHAVLKCVSMGIRVSDLDGLDKRVTPELSRMLAAYAHERIAAGRNVDADVWPLIDRHPPAQQLAAIGAELEHDDPFRRRAAREALADRVGG